jgi:uncharacterized phosphosugar-binding protein
MSMTDPGSADAGRADAGRADAGRAAGRDQAGDGHFLPRLRRLIERLDQQDAAFDAAAELAARAIADDGLVHLYGSGHSVIPVLDTFPRYGSFVGFNPLSDPRLMWHEVLGAGGVRELLWLERQEGYAARYLANRPIAAGDVLVIFSHGGRNAAPVEAALFAREHKAAVVAVTSVRNAELPRQHSSGRHISELADVVIDTGVPAEDALVPVEGWPAPVAGASTILATACVGELVARTAHRLARKGIRMPTFVSPTVPGASLDTIDEVLAAHRRRLLQAEQR